MFEDPSGRIFNKRIMLQFFMMAHNSNMTEKERAQKLCPNLSTRQAPLPAEKPGLTSHSLSITHTWTGGVGTRSIAPPI
jgi:hypothetical protein